MRINYDVTLQSRVDDAGTRTNTVINLRYKEKPTWEIHFVSGGASVNLAAAASWRAAVDKDYSSSTEPMCRSLSNSIDTSRASLGIISVTLDANTVSFFSAVDGKNTSLTGYFELCGIDKNGSCIHYVSFKISLSGVVDPHGGDLPSPVPTGLCSITEIEAALAGKYPLLNRLTINENGQLCVDGTPIHSGGTDDTGGGGNTGGADDTGGPGDTTSTVMYYGYIPYETAGNIQSVTSVTADMLTCDSMTSAEPAALNKTSIGTVPAGAWIIVLIPENSGLTAAKYNGINGATNFEVDNGITGSGANGANVTIGGITYLIYGEFCLSEGEYFIYTNNA